MAPEYRNTKPKVITFTQEDSDGRKQTATARCRDERVGLWDLQVQHPNQKWERTEYGNTGDIRVKLALMTQQYDDEFRRGRMTGDRPRETMRPDRSLSVPEAPVTQTPPNLKYRR